MPKPVLPQHRDYPRKYAHVNPLVQNLGRESHLKSVASELSKDFSYIYLSIYSQEHRAVDYSHIIVFSTVDEKAIMTQPHTRTLGKNGPLVPSMGFGCMGLSAYYTANPAPDAERFQVLDRALELGETFWVTSDTCMCPVDTSLPASH